MLREKMGGLTKPPVPPAYDFLWQPARYKICKGGRGKGATWSIARRLLDRAHSEKRLILCTREFQNSIADSVHRVLVNQIQILGYGEFFRISAHNIRSLVSDSEFIFRGLNDLTADTIRSMEGLTDVWCAEAQKMGKKSWETLSPTVRIEGSEIYADYNPDEETDPTHVMFTVSPPAGSIVRHINFDQNPFFPAVLEQERQESLRRIREAPNDDARDQAQMDYDNIWLGQPRKISKASILGSRWYFEDFVPSTNWDGPYDGADWGFSQDPTVRIRCWIHEKKLYVEREAYAVGVEIKDLPKLFDEFPDSRRVKIRADNARPETISHMKNSGFNIITADKWKGSVEDGVEHLRGAYDAIVVHSRCQNTAREMRNYSYKTDRLTGDILPEIVDLNNHTIDSLRYALDPVIQRRRKGFFS